jgi:hypothetical protein
MWAAVRCVCCSLLVLPRPLWHKHNRHRAIGSARLGIAGTACCREKLLKLFVSVLLGSPNLFFHIIPIAQVLTEEFEGDVRCGRK